jgi:SAM-dependent methyltransferase
MDFADAHPQCRITGTDLSPIQPALVPPNCIFEVDDFNAEWTFDQKFDFIHARTLVGSSKDFPYLIQQAFDSLVPGGYLEMSDVYVPFLDDDGSMRGTYLQAWIDRQLEACTVVGIDPTTPAKYKQWMIDQGFEDVTELKFKWPVGQWAKDPGLKHIGKLTLLNFYTGLEGITLRLWTGALGISYEETLATLANVRKDITNPKIHCYWLIYCVYGRKPAGE